MDKSIILEKGQKLRFTIGMALVLPEASTQRLAQILYTCSYEDRKVILASGRESDFYLDGRQTSLHPEGLYLAGQLMLAAVRETPGIQAVGGPTLGADPLVAGVALLSHLAGDPLPGFIVRKAAKGHGAGNWIEGLKNVPPGATVALLEDTVTTGGSLLRAAERVQEAGLHVARVIVMVDREEGGAEAIEEAGYDYESILTISEVRRAAG